MVIGALAFMPKLNAATNLDEDFGLTKENIFIDEYEKNGYPTITFDRSPIQPRYFTSEMNVTPIKQINSIYCGYAASEEVIRYFNNIDGYYDGSASQEALANEANSAGSALHISKMVTLINNHTNRGYYETYAGNWSLDTFVSKVQASVQANKPMIIMASTWPLSMYNNSKNKTHYLVITGYTRSADENWNNRIIYIDSYYVDYGAGNVFGKHVEPKENMWKTFYGDKVNSIVL